MGIGEPPLRDACFTNVDKFVTPTSACSCLLHMHAGVYYTCTQVSMTHARRCPWYLHADVYYTCLQVTIAQKVTQIGMQLYKTLARRCLWHLHAGVYDTCPQVSMTTARRCLWHLHANTLWSGWCYYNFDTFGYIWLWFIDKLTSWYILSRQFRNFQDNI